MVGICDLIGVWTRSAAMYSFFGCNLQDVFRLLILSVLSCSALPLFSPPSPLFVIFLSRAAQFHRLITDQLKAL